MPQLLVLLQVSMRLSDQKKDGCVGLPRVGIDEMRQMMASEVKPVLLDVRSNLSLELDPPIPGARLLGEQAPAQVLADVAKNHPVIVYCNCPRDASAAKTARELIAAGFLKVRPLRGGLEAWKLPDTAS